MTSKIRRNLAIFLVIIITAALPAVASAASGTSIGFYGIKICLPSGGCYIVPSASCSIRTTQATCPTTPSATKPSTPGNTNTPAPTPAPTEEYYTQGACSAQAKQMAAWINQERGKAGRAPLSLDAALCGAAELKSADMYAKNYFAHQSPTYGSPSEMLKKLGIKVNSVGENIAKHGTLEKAHAALMSSTGHRNNILSGSFTKLGIGVKNVNGYVIVTQLFAR